MVRSGTMGAALTAEGRGVGYAAGDSVGVERLLSVRGAAGVNVRFFRRIVVAAEATRIPSEERERL